MKSLSLPFLWLPLLAGSVQGQRLDSGVVAALKWRSIGPANMGGRIVDIAGTPSPSRTFYVSAAGGGLFKTTNAGTTFRALLDTIPVSSGGMIAVAPSDTNVVYYGTGEPNMRNSVSPGAGIWRTDDGGNTWRRIGLEKTQHIGRIVVHPNDPDIVYVAAVGAAWAANPERGLFKTTDGGRTWRLVKYVSESVGVTDVALNPANPTEVWAATYDFLRTPYYVRSGGAGSGLWKSLDAGESWTEIRGHGFPSSAKGRIGLAIAPSDPRVVYAIVEDFAKDPRRDDVSPDESATGLYRSSDGGRTWQRVNTRNERPFYFSQVRVSPADADKVYWLGVAGWMSVDGGRTVLRVMRNIHVDHHALWIDPTDPEHMIDGNDGGIAQSWDGGRTWDFINTVALGQFYGVSVNGELPYRICGGLQDNGTWCGPSRRKGSITNADWNKVYGADGGFAAQSPKDPDIIVATTQGGGIEPLSARRGERGFVSQIQLHRARGQAEWERVDHANGDGHVFVRRAVTTLADSQTSREDRRNFVTPFILSVHQERTLYVGTHQVIKAFNLGEDVFAISPDLTTRDTLKMREGGSPFRSRDSALRFTEVESYCTITALAESPIRPGMLFAGTDDGQVWLTHNEGASWESLAERIPGVPANSQVSRIEPSRFDPDVFYVTFDNHHRNDFRPYLFMTADGGKSFSSLTDDLPNAGFLHAYVIREDVVNPHLLFLGTETGVYASIDRGRKWTRLDAGLPTVGIRDLAIHPRDRELVAGTHGRSVWILDIAALQQLSDSVLHSRVHLFAPTQFNRYHEPFGDGNPIGAAGDRGFRADGLPDAGVIQYWLRDPEEDVHLVIEDAAGRTLVRQHQGGQSGLRRVLWHFTQLRERPPLTASEARDSVRAARRMRLVLDSARAARRLPDQLIRQVRHTVTNGESLHALAARLRQGYAVAGRSQVRDSMPGEPVSTERPDWTSSLPADVARLLKLLADLGAGSRAPYVTSMTMESGDVPVGDYLVRLQVGSSEWRQVLRVR